jgi:autotransporter translocation and assembly factor TamB
MSLGRSSARFDAVRVTSNRGEPIAEIQTIVIEYNLRDLLPGGTRLFGLKAIDVASPHLTIIRRPDGTYNIPIPRQANQNNLQRPLIARARVTNGQVDIVDDRPSAVPNERHLYFSDLNANADISTADRSQYAIDLRYGERSNQLFAIRGRGDINPRGGYIDQHWTAAALPVAAAVNFVADSSSLKFLAGTIRGLDARYAALPDANGTLHSHFAATAELSGGRIAIAGLAKPITNVRGPVDVYDDGLTTPRLDADVSGTPVRVRGGLYGLQHPQLRMAVAGVADAARLRTAFTQAARLPIGGPVNFALLVEGATAKPVTWIDLHSPRLSYAASTLDSVSSLVAFDGRQADVIATRANYNGVGVTARGRLAFERQPGAVKLLAGIDAPPGAIPYGGKMLPALPLHGIALASADDPRAIALQGALWGRNDAQRLDAIFNVDSRGAGSVGPLHVVDGNGWLYGRIALDRPHQINLGIFEAHGFPIAPAAATASGTIFGGQWQSQIGVGLASRLHGSWGDADAGGRIVSSRGILRGGLFGDVAQSANFAASVSGTLQSPQLQGTVAVAGGRYRNFTVNGNAGMAYAKGSLQVHDADVAVGPLFVGVAGTIAGLSPQGAFAPQYDLAAQVHTSDVSTLLASVQPRTALPVQGSVDADVRIRGTGSSASFGGKFNAPEGSVNGLAFRQFSGAVSGDSQSLSLRSGHAVIGSTAVLLNADATRTRQSVALNAPHTDLADFNDFFDTGDTLAGRGRLTLSADVSNQGVIASRGNANFTGAHFRRIELGDVAAQWHTNGNRIVSALSFGGPTGEVHAVGSVIPAELAVDLRATARGVDLGTWLPMLGMTAPITGRLNAQTMLSGRYPDIAMSLHAAVFGGTAARMQIERFEVTASASHGRGTIESAIFDLPSLHTDISGSFGLRQGDPLDLHAHSVSPDVGRVVFEATGKKSPVTAALDSSLQIRGSLSQPRIRDAIALQSVRYRNLTIPRISSNVEATRHDVRVQDGEIDLTHGRALFSAMAPIRFSRSGVTPAAGPIAASLRADDVELSNFAPLLPKGTQMSGRIDGGVRAGGTVAAPTLNGSLALRQGNFVGPTEKSPITDILADLAFGGTRASLKSRATVGGGTVTASGNASVASLHRPADSAIDFHAMASNARLDMPDYFNGIVNANISLIRSAASTPQMSGDVAFSKARIPIDAFLKQRSGANPNPGLPNVAFSGLRISAGPDVRVLSRNVDIGTSGDVALGGTLHAPTLNGVFRSTGGSLNFYRNFDLEYGTVSFDPSSGLIPDVNAVATTFVTDPATAIRLHATGPATNMNLALASDPAYSRQQILGILVGAQQFGAVRGVRSSGQSGFSATSAATNVALGQVNTLFTRNVLEPFSTSLAGPLGFSAVRITTDVQTGVGISAVKAFGKHVNAIFAQSFGYPKTQSITLEAHPNVGTGLRVTAFTSQGPTVLALQQPQPIGMDVMNLNPLTAFTPVSGSNGFAFSFQRKFP